jgi:hypothetical protein
MRYLLFIFAVVLIFSSCERNISFDLKDTEPKLVVEATIETGQGPIVYLTKSVSYYSKFDLVTLANSFVHHAEVYVSNGRKTHKLKEYVAPLAGGINFYYYATDPSTPATIFTGELKKQYSLRIVTEGKEYTATTMIPDTTKRIDTLYGRPAPAGNLPDQWALMLKATDKPGLGDYIRYFTKRNHEPFYPGVNSAYDDQVIDGSTYEVQVERGVDRTIDHPEGWTYFFAGDTVTLKLCTIDKATFDFWRTMEFAYDNLGNPFATPTKVLSNISGGALGYFGGYAPQFRTIVLPR